MPDLQVLVQHLVETAVGRALGPVLDKQHELETALKALRDAQLRTETSSSPRVQPKREPDATAGSLRNDANPFTSPSPSPAAPNVSYKEIKQTPVPEVSRPASNVAAVQFRRNTYNTDTFEDIPSELNGSRRKKVVIWAFALLMMLVLISAVGFSALSNMGTHF
jgi:hypothetical protein